MSAVAMMVSEPPSSMFRAAPKNRFGRWSALASTPPVSTLPGRRHDGVVGAGEARDRIEQDHDVLLVLDQALRLFDHHFRDLHVARRRLVERRRHDLAAHRALHLGHFLGPLVDQEHDQHDVGIVRGDRVRHVLQHHRLARLRRRHQEPALALADRRDDVDDPAGDVLLGLDVALEDQGLVREERRQVLEQDLVLGVLGGLAVDLVDLDQREVALAVLGRADLALDRVAGVQVEAADLRRRDVDVVGPGEVARVGRAQEAEAVGQDFEHALAEDRLALLRLRLEHREDEVVLAHAVRALDLHRVGDVEKLADVL